jgi:AraC family ethanolamine operon transcriptional activator
VETRSFNDFDEFAEAVSSFDGRIMLTHPSIPKWSVSHLDLDGVHIQTGVLGSGNIVEGQSWDGYMVYLPIPGAGKKILNGSEVSKDSLLIFEPCSEISLCSTSEHNWCSIFVPTDVWTRAGYPLKLSLGGEKGACQVTRPNRQLYMHGRSLVRDMQLAATTCPQFETTPAMKIAAAEAAKFVFRIASGSHIDEPAETGGRPQISRQKIIRCCNRLLDKNEDRHVSVGELATAAGVSVRTLETAFKEYFDDVPSHYLQLRRIKQIHSALCAAKVGEKTVTEILADHGEWEFGRFAGNYRSLYGEFPSQTLQAP